LTGPSLQIFFFLLDAIAKKVVKTMDIQYQAYFSNRSNKSFNFHTKHSSTLQSTRISRPTRSLFSHNQQGNKQTIPPMAKYGELFRPNRSAT
jgi:hypothetical protein